MKKMILLMFVLISCSCLYAQTVIPKGTNQIMIKNDKTAADNFLFVKKALAKNGTDIATQDRDINQIRTGEIHNKWGSSQYYVILCEDNLIQLSGSFKTGITLDLGGVSDTDPYETITYRGMKGSLYVKTFSIMDDFARSLGENISYVNTSKK